MDEEEEKDEEIKYVKIIYKNPNPLFVKWITEWLEEARKRNMQLQYNLEKALESLKKFPIPLKTGKECLILEHFGSALCRKLDRELYKYEAAKLNNSAKPLAIPGPSTSDIYNFQNVIGKITGPTVPEPAAVFNGYDAYRHNRLFEIDKPSPQNLVENHKRRLDTKKTLGIDTPSPQNLFGNDNPNPRRLIENDHSSPKKIFGTEIPATATGTETVRPSRGEFSGFRLSALGNNKAYESIFQEVERNVYEFPPDIDVAENVVITTQENSTINSKKETTVGPDKRNYAEASPQKTAFSPRKPSAFGIGSGSSTSSFEARRQMIGASPVKRKLATPSPKKSPRKPANSLFAADDDDDAAPLSQLSSIGGCSQTQEEAFTFSPGEFRIKLLVDTAETFGHMAKRSRREEEATAYLTELGVSFEVRRLTVGDFVWVCQDGAGRELVLPYIVERKRADDLAKSIKDGRFREQKFRLKQLPIAERIYLVEELKKKDRSGLPFSTLMQAATNTQVIDGFKVKFTNNLKHSMQYLAIMTEFLNETFNRKMLMSCPKEQLPPFNIEDDLSSLMTFKDFAKDTAKKRKYTVREMFIKQLLQLRGMSVEKAKAVVKVYPTPFHLMDACCTSESRKLLSKLKIGALGHSLGPVLSATIHDFYSKKEFD